MGNGTRRSRKMSRRRPCPASAALRSLIFLGRTSLLPNTPGIPIETDATGNQSNLAPPLIAVPSAHAPAPSLHWMRQRTPREGRRTRSQNRVKIQAVGRKLSEGMRILRTYVTTLASLTQIVARPLRILIEQTEGASGGRHEQMSDETIAPTKGRGCTTVHSLARPGPT